MLPLDFIDNIEAQLGQDTDAFCRALQREATVSVRLNPEKCRTKDNKPRFNYNWVDSEVSWCPDAYYLRERPQFTLDPLMHAGCYYVQEASSMFLWELLEQYVDPASIVLDLCAAPGGKSTLISQYLADEGLLISNEVVRQRVFILSENIQKWGNGNTIVTHNKPIDFGERLPNLFDCILVDAPCSGEGMFRKDKKAIDEWSLKNVDMCAARQRSILSDVWDSLKPGGLLIYSTCTFNRKENEDNVQWIKDELGADILPIDLDPMWGITQSNGCHFYPHKTKGEGLFMAILRKKNANYKPLKIKGEKKKQSLPIECEYTLRSWINMPEHWAMRQTDRFTIAYPVQFRDLIDLISARMTCISTGFGVGEMRGKQPAPQHALAMSKYFKQETFPQIEIDQTLALKYLRTESLVFEGQPFGYLLLTYMGLPLGFVKNVENHSNNLYPNEWRIRNL